MDHSSMDAEGKLIRDFVRWYYYDGSVGGLEWMVEHNKYIMNLEKEYLDVLEKRP